MEKPLGMKAYGSIPHLVGSRMGPSDHHAQEGQVRICTEQVRDRHDVVIVQEKLDGSCTSVAMLGDGQIVALNRSGWPAQSSRYRQHQLFADWVRRNESRFRECLRPGERLVGEWLIQAHGTRYQLWHEPWVVFDLIRGKERATLAELTERTLTLGFKQPTKVHEENAPLSIQQALEKLGEHGYHGALDPVEGAVWRVERRGKVDFLAKYVRPDKVDGCYLPEITGGEPVWNSRFDWFKWFPDSEKAEAR